MKAIRNGYKYPAFVHKIDYEANIDSALRYTTCID